MHHTAQLAALGALIASARAATYSLYSTAAGASFFDSWTYTTGYDNFTTGDVNYVQNSSLAYVAPNGSAIMRVSTDFVPYNEKRNSVRVVSQQAYGLGNVVVLDAAHVPGGCSVWPAFYFIAANNTWPAGGEIDVFEQQNNAKFNQMSIHTAGTCAISASSASTMTGTVGSTNCAVGTSNTGCTVLDTAASSYNTGFNAAGGGVWALEMAATGFNAWFFSRASVPSNLGSSSKSIDTSSWGTPTAVFSSASCPLSNFGAQQAIITTTLCGQWAGLPSVYSQTCGSGNANASSCYLENVINSGSNYANAYWEINSFRVFAASLQNANVSGIVASTANTASTTGAAKSGSAPAASGTSAGKSAAARSYSVTALPVVAPAILAGLVALVARLTLA